MCGQRKLSMSEFIKSNSKEWAGESFVNILIYHKRVQRVHLLRSSRKCSPSPMRKNARVVVQEVWIATYVN